MAGRGGEEGLASLHLLRDQDKLGLSGGLRGLRVGAGVAEALLGENAELSLALRLRGETNGQAKGGSVPRAAQSRHGRRT